MTLQRGDSVNVHFDTETVSGMSVEPGELSSTASSSLLFKVLFRGPKIDTA